MQLLSYQALLQQKQRAQIHQSKKNSLANVTQDSLALIRTLHQHDGEEGLSKQELGTEDISGKLRKAELKVLRTVLEVSPDQKQLFTQPANNRWL